MRTTVSFFHVDGGVGRTTLTQHLAVMASRLGRRVLAVDLDPQADLTARLVPAPHLWDVWAEDRRPTTVADALAPVLDGVGEPLAVTPREFDDRLWLLPGDLALTRAEVVLAEHWPAVLHGSEAALRATTAVHHVVDRAAEQVGADLVLLDLGPNLGALNHAALLATDHIVTPVRATGVSVLALRQLGEALDGWRSAWHAVTGQQRSTRPDVLPAGALHPAGYLVREPALRFDRPVQPRGPWRQRLPEVYAASVLAASGTGGDRLIAQVPDYSVVLSMAVQAEKAIFDLAPADGATGGVMTYVMKCRQQFEDLTRAVLARVEGPRHGAGGPAAPSSGRVA